MIVSNRDFTSSPSDYWNCLRLLPVVIDTDQFHEMFRHNGLESFGINELADGVDDDGAARPGQ
ncbi:MAG TPA: hypothetical protein VK208_16985 [Pyrinomonadaceae bacterium]|nr:hypothetical protein [Pyrinomonadaceae bacterium]